MTSETKHTIIEALNSLRSQAIDVNRLDAIERTLGTDDFSGAISTWVCRRLDNIGAAIREVEGL